MQGGLDAGRCGPCTALWSMQGGVVNEGGLAHAGRSGPSSSPLSG